MSDRAPDSDFSQRQHVLVFLKREEMPEIDSYITTLEKNRAMGKWLDEKSFAVEQKIRELGGIILQRSWFWAGLRVELPIENIENNIAIINSMAHVNGVHFSS